MVPALPSPHLCMPCPRLTAPPGSPSLLPSAFHTRLSWVGTISVTRWKCILSSFGDVRVSWPFFIRSDPPLKFPPLPWDPGCFGPFGRVRSSMAFPFILYLLQPPACLWPFTRGLPSLQLCDNYLCGGGHGGGQRSAPLEEDGKPPGVCAALGSGRCPRAVVTKRGPSTAASLPPEAWGLLSTAPLQDPSPELKSTAMVSLQNQCSLCSFDVPSPRRLAQSS